VGLTPMEKTPIRKLVEDAISALDALPEAIRNEI
jgi:hypothetical protein